MITDRPRRSKRRLRHPLPKWTTANGNFATINLLRILTSIFVTLYSPTFTCEYHRVYIHSVSLVPMCAQNSPSPTDLHARAGARPASHPLDDISSGRKHDTMSPNRHPDTTRSLPIEVKHRIASYLNATDTTALARVDRQWQAACEEFNWESVSIFPRAGEENPRSCDIINSWANLSEVLDRRPQLARHTKHLCLFPDIGASGAMDRALSKLSPHLRRITFMDRVLRRTDADTVASLEVGAKILKSVGTLSRLVKLTCILSENWSELLFRVLRSTPQLEHLHVTAFGRDQMADDSLLPHPVLLNLRSLHFDASGAFRATVALMEGCKDIESIRLTNDTSDADDSDAFDADSTANEDHLEYDNDIHKFLGYTGVRSLSVGRGYSWILKVDKPFPGEWLPSLESLCIRTSVSEAANAPTRKDRSHAALPGSLHSRRFG